MPKLLVPFDVRCSVLFDGNFGEMRLFSSLNVKPLPSLLELCERAASLLPNIFSEEHELALSLILGRVTLGFSELANFYCGRPSY